jgi:predicted metal-dependent hydrolase
MDPETYDPRYLRGVQYFNRHAFFESHDAWEEVWLEETGPAKDFFKGLIQGAVALYHFRNRNFGGARKLWTGCQRLLEPFRPKYLGLDVEGFLKEMSNCFAELFRAPAAGPPPHLAGERVPRIQLDPAP